MPERVGVEVGGRQLSLSNLEKVFYPSVGFTKAQVIQYYTEVGPTILPHLRGRCLTLKRYPDGVEAQHFYEKECPRHHPEWVQTARVWSGSNRKWINYCVVDGLPTLVWAANLASIELHTSLALADDVATPTMVVFDLDPGPPADIVQCCQVGLWIQALLEDLGLQSFPKTSGSKGLQVYVPLNTPVTYEQTKSFANLVARRLETDHPALVTSNMKKELRTRKVFVDWSQNDDHKTTVSVYSLRAREHPTVSTPVGWDEVAACLKKEDRAVLTFEVPAVLQRIRKHGDRFEPVLSLEQRLA